MKYQQLNQVITKIDNNIIRLPSDYVANQGIEAIYQNIQTVLTLIARGNLNAQDQKSLTEEISKAFNELVAKVIVAITTEIASVIKQNLEYFAFQKRAASITQSITAIWHYIDSTPVLVPKEKEELFSQLLRDAAQELLKYSAKKSQSTSRRKQLLAKPVAPILQPDKMPAPSCQNAADIGIPMQPKPPVNFSAQNSSVFFSQPTHNTGERDPKAIPERWNDYLNPPKIRSSGSMWRKTKKAIVRTWQALKEWLLGVQPVPVGPKTRVATHPSSSIHSASIATTSTAYANSSFNVAPTSGSAAVTVASSHTTANAAAASAVVVGREAHNPSKISSPDGVAKLSDTYAYDTALSKHGPEDISEASDVGARET